MRNLTARAVVAAAVLFITLVEARAQQAFRDEQLGFSLTIPQGWSKVARQALDKFTITPPSGGSAEALAGYVRSGGELKPPCIVIERRTQPFDLAEVTWEQLSQRLNLTPYEDLKKNGQFDVRGRYRGDNLSPATLVEGNQFILVQGVTTGADGGPVFLYSVGFLGRHDIVRMNAFVPVDSADSFMKQFEDMMHSGRFDEGKQFRAQATTLRSRSHYRRHGGTFGGVGAGIALIAYLIRRWAAD